MEKECIICFVTICNYLFLSRNQERNDPCIPTQEGIFVDELLPRPRSIYLPAPVRTREKAPAARKPLSLPRLSVGWALPNFLERRTKAGPAIFLTLALGLSSTAVLTHLYAPCVQVEVNGVDLGLIQSQAMVENAVERVEARASTILGYDYVLDQNITYSPRLALKEDQATASHVETYLFDQIGEVMQTSMLSVNGKELGAIDDGDALNALLDSILDTYKTENTVSAVFVESVMINRQYSPTADLRELSALSEILHSNSMEQVDYTVKSGDTFSGIAYNLDMTMSELKALNPDVKDRKSVV